MFFKIIKRDLKRRKSMNIILFLFMMMIGMLVASSATIFYTETRALPDFMKKANLSDLTVVAFEDKQGDQSIISWAEDNPRVKSYDSNNTLFIKVDALEIPGRKEPYEMSTTVMLSTQNKKYNLIFNEEDQLLQVNPGEIAIPNYIVSESGLKIGDKVIVKQGDVRKELTVSHYTKDVAFGANLMGFKLLILNEADYQDFERMNSDDLVHIWFFEAAKGTDSEALAKEFNQVPAMNIAGTIPAGVVRSTYVMDMLLAGLMIVISIFLMLIAFLILRFTIVFTLQEEYKEIGIMKAIGLKDKKIGNLFLVKYLFLSLCGAGIGLLLSIPFSGKMLESISKNMILSESGFTFFLKVLSVLVVVLITLLFCRMCTRRIRKYSAIDAIRNGTTGERFTTSRKLVLNRRKRMSVPFFMALSDLAGGWKRFVILAITFILGTVLVLVPINVINTMASGDLLQYFGFSRSVDLFVDTEDLPQIVIDKDTEALTRLMDGLEERFAEQGYPSDVYSEVYYLPKIYANEEKDGRTVLTMQAIDQLNQHYDFLQGEAPILDNEIAITQVLAEYLGVGIGDTIHLKMGERTYDFMVTALFQSMNQFGYGARLPKSTFTSIEGCSGINMVSEFIDAKDTADSIKKLKSMNPDIRLLNSTEFFDHSMGHIGKQMDVVKNLVLSIVLAVIFLITVLLVKMMISREVAEIAILKSMGFRNRTIKSWQMIRIAMVLLISVVIGTLIGNHFGHYMTDGIFAYMGATQIELKIIPQQVYLIYPGFMLAITLVAVALSLGQIKRIHVWEINNQE